MQWKCDDLGEMETLTMTTEQLTPQVNGSFRFDDGTIGTITATSFKLGKQVFPSIVVYSEKYGHCSFTIRSLTLYQAPVTANAVWTVKG